MKSWIDKAKSLLRDSLFPVPAELNSLDWKSGVSPNNERLAQHISAFANYNGGGVFAFGVNNDATLASVSKEEADFIITKLGNIASNRLNIPIQLEHTIEDIEGHSILFVYVPEQIEKPVYLKGGTIYDSYYRSSGQTRKMTSEQVRSMIALSQGLPYEFMIAKKGLSTSMVLSLLDFNKFLELSKKNLPKELDTVVSMMADYHLCEVVSEGWAITNMGALLFANNLSDFTNLSGKAIIIRKYTGNSNLELDFETKSSKGYAVELEDLVELISNSTQGREIIEGGIREQKQIYPKVAIREILANAMVHQNLFEIGMSVTVEIYQDRIAITNPGSCLNDITRIIDLPPHSRNEKLAEALFLFGICEKRGSGMDRTVAAIEEKCLPPIKVTSSEIHTRVFIYAPKKWTKMTSEERVQACYQHTCLLYERNQAMNNQSLRERLGMERRATAQASRIISDTVQRKLIKPENAQNESKKMASYIPFYG